MIHLSVGLGWTAMRQVLIIKSSDGVELCNYLKQHSLILGEKIISYYENGANKDGLGPDIIKTCFSANSYFSREFEWVKSDNLQSAQEEFSKALKKNKDNSTMIICSEDGLSFSKSTCRYQYTMEKALEKDSIIVSHSVPFNIILKKGDGVRWVLKLLEDYLYGEKEVHIIDPFLVDNRNVIINRIFPMLSGGTRLSIHLKDYLNDDNWKIQEIIAEANKNNISLSIYCYEEMHDRFIITDDVNISIGYGLAFVEGDIIRKNTSISIFPIDKELAEETLGEFVRNIAGKYVREVEIK